MIPRLTALLPGFAALLLLAGCVTRPPGTPAARVGDEIIVAGQLFHTGTRVVTWMDPAGYDAYRVERRFSPWAETSWEKTPDEIGRAHVCPVTDVSRMPSSA